MQRDEKEWRGLASVSFLVRASQLSLCGFAVGWYIFLSLVTMEADVKTLKMGEGGKSSNLQEAFSLHSAAPTAASSLLQGLMAWHSTAAQNVQGEKQINNCPTWLHAILSPVAEQHLGFFYNLEYGPAWNMALPLQRTVCMFHRLCAKNQSRHFVLTVHWCTWFCCNSVRIPLKRLSELISGFILSAYMSSLLPAKGGRAGRHTDMETLTFPSIDKLSWPGPHHFQQLQLLPQHWKQSCDGSFRISSVYGLYFRSHEHERLSTLYD